MFYYLHGLLVLCESGQVVVDCGGVGYALTVSMNTAEQLADKTDTKVKLFTHLQVREDGVELFGFGSRQELSAFRLLTSVSGVGPKAAMAILSLFTPDRFAYAVCTEDVKALARASGVGAKTAARIVLELKDKISKDQMQGGPIGKMPSGVSPTAPMQKGGKLGEAADALSVLGYSGAEIGEVLRGLDVTNMTLEAIITAALKKFAERS